MSHFQKQVQEFLSDSEDLVELARSEYILDNDDQLPAHDESLCLYLTDYTGEERDLLWWGGRFSLALELDNQNNTPIRVPLTESDLYDLLSGEVTFHWSFSGVNLFLFNTDCRPELDPDSDEYDPSEKTISHTRISTKVLNTGSRSHHLPKAFITHSKTNMTIDQLIHLIRNPETRDKGSSILNDIIHDGYDMHLVTCPRCGQIHSFLPHENEHDHTCTCGAIFNQNEAPDLFFF